MPGAFVLSIEVEGEQQVLRAFSRFGEYVDDMQEPFGKIADAIPKIVGEAYGAGGPGWPALSTGYAAWKSVHYPGKSILVRTSAGKGALTGTSGWARQISPSSMKTSFSAVPYMKFHQTGTGRMPKRKLLDIKPEHRTAFTKVIQRYLVGKARETGLGGGA